MPVCFIHMVFAEYVSEVLHMISGHDLGNDKCYMGFAVCMSLS